MASKEAEALSMAYNAWNKKFEADKTSAAAKKAEAPLRKMLEAIKLKWKEDPESKELDKHLLARSFLLGESEKNTAARKNFAKKAADIVSRNNKKIVVLYANGENLALAKLLADTMKAWVVLLGVSDKNTGPHVQKLVSALKNSAANFMKPDPIDKATAKTMKSWFKSSKDVDLRLKFWRETNAANEKGQAMMLSFYQHPGYEALKVLSHYSYFIKNLVMDDPVARNKFALQMLDLAYKSVPAAMGKYLS